MRRGTVVNVSKISRCMPSRCKITLHQATGKKAARIEVFCNPEMTDSQWEIMRVRVKQVVEVEEFYSEETNRHFFIYFKYDKTRPVEYIR